MLLAIDPSWHWKLGAMVAEERLVRGLTQTELAAALSTQQKVISNIENGRRRIDLFELLAIERALGMVPLRLAYRVMQGVD